MPEIIAVGELLIDLISTEYADDFLSADTYQRLPGGSPANLAMNLARLGRDVGLVATVGEDDAGSLLIDAVRDAGVDTSAIVQVAEPTTLILVTKSRAVSDFEPYRLADRFISAEQMRMSQGVRILHSTAFALSKEPARSNILAGMELARQAGIRLSVDFNYADKIWASDREVGLATLATIAAAGGLIKVSEVDFERLFGVAVTDHHAAAQRIMKLGAHLVCLTLGEEGCYVMHQEGAFYLPARKVEVKDTTGAGDAFWSGFLAAHLAGYGWEACAHAGRGMAELKLGTVGPLSGKVNLESLVNN